MLSVVQHSACMGSQMHTAVMLLQLHTVMMHVPCSLHCWVTEKQVHSMLCSPGHQR
jgi:hypothetical protein